MQIAFAGSGEHRRLDASEAAADRSRQPRGQISKPTGIGNPASPVCDHLPTENAGSGRQGGVKAAGDAEAHEPSSAFSKGGLDQRLDPPAACREALHPGPGSDCSFPSKT